MIVENQAGWLPLKVQNWTALSILAILVSALNFPLNVIRILNFECGTEH